MTAHNPADESLIADGELTATESLIADSEAMSTDSLIIEREPMSLVASDVARPKTATAKVARSDSFVRTLYFPTMIYQYDVEGSENLNKLLLGLTYAEREGGIANNKSNTAELGSWHSATMLHKNPDYGPLMTEVDAALSWISDELRYASDQVLRVTSMWSIINPPANGNRAHVHPNSLWSGVYYIQAPESGGKTEFIDPRTSVIMNQPKYEAKKKRPRECWTKVNYKPVAGRMVIFPAWLYHGVDPNITKEKGRAGDRVIISFNINQVKR